ncbi:hypothetical protein V5G28_022325 [Scytonema sp. PRP1]
MQVHVHNLEKFFNIYKVKVERILRLRERSPEVECRLSDRLKSSIRRAIAHHLRKIKTPFSMLRGRGVVSYFCKLLIISCRQT